MAIKTIIDVAILLYLICGFIYFSLEDMRMDNLYKEQLAKEQPNSHTPPTKAKCVKVEYDFNRTCRYCPLKTVPRPVRGIPGNKRLGMTVGEAPGKEENDVGKPFVGPSGKNLDELLSAQGLTRSDFFITNAVKCWPTELSYYANMTTRKPTSDELEACRPCLTREIETYNPHAILMLGESAIKQCLSLNSSEVNGVVIAKAGHVTLKDGRLYIWGVHPSPMNMNDPERKEAALRACAVFKKALNSLQFGTSPDYLIASGKFESTDHK